MLIKVAKFLLSICLFFLLWKSMSSSDDYLVVQGSAFWNFFILGSIFILGYSLLLMAKKVEFRLYQGISLFGFFLFAIFDVFSQIAKSGNVTWNLNIWIVFSVVFVVVLVATFKDLVSIGSLSRMVLFLVIYEIFICLMQFFQVASNSDSFFDVYGTMPNPNISAMFLAISSPFILYGIKNNRKYLQLIYVVAYVGVFISIILLASRTALIGYVISSLFFILSRFNRIQGFLRFFKIKRVRFFYVSTLSIIVGIIVLASTYFFDKKDSLEGRLLIWKISLGLGAEKPMLGHGAGSFEKVYNLAQSKYFSTQQRGDIESFNADHIQIAYNDYVQNFVEGGFVRLMLFVLFAYCLLFRYNRATQSDERAFAYSGILSFFIMALFNTVLIAVPVFIMFLFFVGVQVSEDKGKVISLPSRIIGLTLFLFGTIFFSISMKRSVAEKRLKKAYLLSNKSPENALSLLKPYRKVLKMDAYFWSTVGKYYQKKGKMKKAIRAYSYALKFSSHPNVFRELSFSLEALGRYRRAIQTTTIVSNMIPSRIWPRLDLMRLYYKMGDLKKSRKIGQKILLMKQKGVTDIEPIKQSVREFLKILDHEIIED